MYRTILTSLLLAAAAFMLTACNSGRTTGGQDETNILGIVTYDNASFESTGPATFAVSTDELYSRQNFSGDKMTFLWGLVTLKDY